jgi:hypothetical protein
MDKSNAELINKSKTYRKSLAASMAEIDVTDKIEGSNDVLNEHYRTVRDQIRNL